MTAATATSSTYREAIQALAAPAIVAPSQPVTGPEERPATPARPVAAEAPVAAGRRSAEEPVAPGISVRMLGLRSTSRWLGIRVADLGMVAEARAKADVALCPLCRRQHDWEL